MTRTKDDVFKGEPYFVNPDNGYYITKLKLLQMVEEGKR
jgi:hypothetical protein